MSIIHKLSPFIDLYLFFGILTWLGLLFIILSVIIIFIIFYHRRKKIKVNDNDP